MAPARTTKVPLGPLTFDVQLDGPDDGEPVVLLHGFPQTSEAWSKQRRALAAAGYRVVAPDQRGYSVSARPRAVSAYRVDVLAGDVLGIADHLGLDRFHVVGHDWGGVVAWALASRHGDRLRTATVLSSPHPRALMEAAPRSLQPLRSAYVALFKTPLLPELLLGAMGGAVLRVGLQRSGLPRLLAEHYADAMRVPGALSAALAWYRGNGVRSLRWVGEVDVPTLFVWGAQDPALGRTAAERTAAWCTGPYRFVPLEDAGHWLPEREADVLEPLLLEHLAGATAAPSPPSPGPRRSGGAPLQAVGTASPGEGATRSGGRARRR